MQYMLFCRGQMAARVKEEEALIRSLDEMMHKASVNESTDFSIFFWLYFLRLSEQFKFYFSGSYNGFKHFFTI